MPGCPGGRRDSSTAVEGNEILSVIQRRLLAKIPPAEEDGIALRDRVRDAYPFHPALIDSMRERWAAIPEFQRTRGALRFLAACLRSCHREGKSRAVLGPGEVPIQGVAAEPGITSEQLRRSEIRIGRVQPPAKHLRLH